jgi:protein-tyrosine-phosphatase
MAAALAPTVLIGVEAQSAGIDAGESRARRSAIDVMRADYGVDLSQHCPRDVEDIDLSQFDLFVAMKPHIARDSESRLKVSPSRIVTWDVDDPARGDIELYRRCAAGLLGNIRTLANQLEEQSRGGH